MYVYVYTCTYVCCSVLQCVAVCCCVVQCVTACCNVLPPSFLRLSPSPALPASPDPDVLLLLPLFCCTVFTQYRNDFLHLFLVA